MQSTFKPASRVLCAQTVMLDIQELVSHVALDSVVSCQALSTTKPPFRWLSLADTAKTVCRNVQLLIFADAFG